MRKIFQKSTYLENDETPQHTFTPRRFVLSDEGVNQIELIRANLRVRECNITVNQSIEAPLIPFSSPQFHSSTIPLLVCVLLLASYSLSVNTNKIIAKKHHLIGSIFDSREIGE